MEDFYVAYAETLRNAKVLEIELMLTPQDISRYLSWNDTTGTAGALIPVYLGGDYGAYFYINKIKNFVAGKPTRVELMRL